MAKYPFQYLDKKFKVLRARLPMILAEVAINDFQENFKRQGYRNNSGGIVKWKMRQPNNNDNERGVLIGKGSAHMSRDFHNRSNHAFSKVVNKTKYAQVHNEGLKLKGKKRKFDGFTKTGRVKFKNTSAQAEMPKRPFMITTNPLLKDIEKEAFNELDKLWQSL